MRSCRHNALWTFVIKKELRRKRRKSSGSFHQFFFNSLNEWRTSCYSNGGARVLDEVRFIPLRRPRSRHQPKKNTPLILTTAYRMHTKVSFCILIEHQIETDDCGIDTHFHNVQYKVA